jgi:Zn-dependent protease with chaperone function
MRPEREAWRCLNRCRRAIGEAVIPSPVPVDLWIEHPLGLELDITDLSSLGAGILGATYISDRKIAISDALVEQHGRFRFTCAHELGHLVLHVDEDVLFRDDAHTILAARSKTIEREADQFAAAFLMPISLLEVELRRAVGSLDAMRQLGDDGCASTWDHEILPPLEERFGVSRAAAIVRCANLRWRNVRPLMSDAVREQLLRTHRPITDESQARLF